MERAITMLNWWNHTAAQAVAQEASLMYVDLARNISFHPRRYSEK
jgi:hypothetical protein